MSKKQNNYEEILWAVFVHLSFIAVGITLIGMPFQALAEREDPIDSVTEVLLAAVAFMLFISFGVYCIWMVVCVAATALLATFWWGHLKKGMRQEDVLHILGQPTWKFDGKDILGGRETTWHYRYRWFRLRGYVEFGANDTVVWIQMPKAKPEERYPGQFHGW